MSRLELVDGVGFTVLETADEVRSMLAEHDQAVVRNFVGAKLRLDKSLVVGVEDVY